MQHKIPLEQFGPRGKAMADAVQACVHCGFCLPACPTYQVLGQEMDSPRGRIYLMKEVLEGKLAPEAAQPHVDRCLGCLACETACPSGVAYHQLLSPFRERREPQRQRTLIEKLQRWAVTRTLPYPKRFRWAVKLGRITRSLHSKMPAPVRPMLAMLPPTLPPPVTLPALTPAQGKRKARVALLAGCVQQALDPDINLATIRVLSRCGVEVVVPPTQGCCGALAWHVGDGEQARALAQVNLSAFPGDIDAVVTNAAGCGSGVKEYKLIFAGTAHEDRAAALATKAIDVSEMLIRVGLAPPPALDRPVRVAYHDACHLAHAQQVRAAPRRLLAAVPGLELVEIADGDTCCGSAGTYNLDQPAIADELGQRKARNILATGGGIVAAGNIGCMVQIRTHLARLAAAEGKSPPPILHTVQILDRALAGTLWC